MPPKSFNLTEFTDALLTKTPFHKCGLKKEDIDIILDCLDKEKFSFIKGEKHIKISPTKTKSYILYYCCVKCERTDKDTSYPMCYSCFREWDALPFNSPERRKWWNVNLRPEEEEEGFLSTTDEEEEEEFNCEYCGIETNGSENYKNHEDKTIYICGSCDEKKEERPPTPPFNPNTADEYLDMREKDLKN